MNVYRIADTLSRDLTASNPSCMIGPVSTSLGEASTRIQATDPERRKTPRVRTAPPGLRVEPRWLPARIVFPGQDTSCGAKALTRGVRISDGRRVLLLCCA